MSFLFRLQRYQASLPKVGRNDIDLCLRTKYVVMKKEKYSELFAAFRQAPMEEFLKLLFKGVSADIRKQLVLEEVAYHRMNADIVALDVWMCVAPVESNRWIWALVEMNGASGTIEEQFFTKDNYRQQALGSLEECIDYYKRRNKNEDTTEPSRLRCNETRENRLLEKPD